MTDADVAEVTAIYRLEDSPLTLEQRRPEVQQAVGEPCSVIQASYRLRGPQGAITPAAIEEAKRLLRAKGIRLGQVEMPPPRSPPESPPPDGPAEIIVATSGEQLMARVVDCWELSVPVVIMLLYVQAPVEQLSHLVGKQVRVRRLTGG
jgi:hypothetical protein